MLCLFYNLRRLERIAHVYAHGIRAPLRYRSTRTERSFSTPLVMGQSSVELHSFNQCVLEYLDSLNFFEGDCFSLFTAYGQKCELRELQEVIWNTEQQRIASRSSKNC